MRALSSDERVARHQAVRHVDDRSRSLALRRCSMGRPVSMRLALLLRVAYRRWRGLLPLAAAVVMFSGGTQAANDPAVVQSAFRFSRAVQQHLSTGFPLRGAHEIARCESCHVRGVFKGTPKDCATCHGPGARISSVTMTAGHPVVTQPCTVCHNQISFSGIKFDHTNAMPGNVRHVPQRHAGIGKAARTRGDHAILRYVPQVNDAVGGRVVRSHVGSRRDLPDVPQRHDGDRKTRQPHGDLGVLRQLPSDHRMEEGEFQSRGSRGRNLRQLPQRDLGERHAADSRAGQRILRRLPQDVHLRRHRDESRGVRERLRGVPRHGEDLLRRKHQDAAAKPRSGQRDCVRGMPRLCEFHRVLRHTDEPPAGFGDGLCNVPRDGQKLLRRIHRHPAHAGAGPHPPVDRRLRHLSYDELVRGCKRLAGKSHPDRPGVRAVSHEPAELQAGHHEPHRHRQRLHHVSRSKRWRNCVCRRDARSSRPGSHADRGRLHDMPRVDSPVRSRDGDESRRDRRRLRNMRRERQEFRRCENRHSTDARTRSESPCHGRLRNMSYDDILRGRRRQAREPHSDEPSVHALPRQSAELQAGR